MAPPIDPAFRFRVIAEHTADWQFWVREDGSVEYISPDCERISGYPREEFLSGRAGLKSYVHPDDYPAVKRHYKAASGGQEGHDVEFRILRRDGTCRWGSVSYVPVRDEAGRSFGFRGSIRDINDRKEAEEERRKLQEQLIQAQKMEAFGRLAGGIAHEFNNYLGGIIGFASFLRMQAGPDSPHAAHLALIEKSADRAAELTRQLLGFARGGEREIRDVRLNDVVSSVLAIVRQTFDRAIAIEEDLDPVLRIVRGDPGQFEQVLLNVCLNARDAMSGGGTLLVRTRNADAIGGSPCFAAGAANGPSVLLTVRDTGTGIPPAVRDRIFEPFFTTKEPGKGTGMGLAVVYGIVKGHGGTIEVDSKPGRGTAFHIRLPAAGG